VAIADHIAKRHVFGVQICGTRSSAFFEVRPKLSMVEHDQDFICAFITAETSGEQRQQSEFAQNRLNTGVDMPRRRNMF